MSSATPYDLRPVCEAIRDAAAELFAQQGFHAVGVQAIADQAGHTKRSLYKCFGDKDGLIVAVLDYADWEWELAVDRAYADEERPDVVTALLDELAEAPVYNPLVLIARGWLELVEDGKARDKARDALDTVRGTFERIARGAGQPVGSMAADRAMAVVVGASVLSGTGADDGYSLHAAAAVARFLLEPPKPRRPGGSS